MNRGDRVIVESHLDSIGIAIDEFIGNVSEIYNGWVVVNDCRGLPWVVRTKYVRKADK